MIHPNFTDFMKHLKNDMICAARLYLLKMYVRLEKDKDRCILTAVLDIQHDGG